jgi:hypothetical protein
MYIGPEVMMPVASALAGVAGVAMMFGRRTMGLLRLGLHACSKRFSRRSSR